MTRTPTLRRALTALGLLAALALTACGGEGDSSASASSSDGKVTLRVGVQKDGIRAVLDRTNALDGAPYEVEFSTFQFGPPLVEAAGAVVLRRPAGKQPQVLLIHRPAYHDWSLPKGKLDPDEYLAAAAVRETFEESGVAIRLTARSSRRRMPPE